MSNTENTETKIPTCNCRSVVAYRVTADDIPESDPETFAEFDVYESCGTAVNKGKEFAPGHDAKLKSVLIKTFRSGEEFAFLDGGMLIHANPVEIAKQRGWEKFLTPAKPRKARVRKASGTKAVTEAAGFNPCQVKIGRWWKDGSVLAMLDDGQVSVAYTDAKGKRHEVTVPANKVKVG